MVLNKFKKQLENMETSEILGSKYECKKCSTNKVDIIKTSNDIKIKEKKNKIKKKEIESNTSKLKETKSSLVKKILLISILTILIFAIIFNIGKLDNFNLNMIYNKINSLKHFIINKIIFYLKPEIILDE